MMSEDELDFHLIRKPAQTPPDDDNFSLSTESDDEMNEVLEPEIRVLSQQSNPDVIAIEPTNRASDQLELSYFNQPAQGTKSGRTADGAHNKGIKIVEQIEGNPGGGTVWKLSFPSASGNEPHTFVTDSLEGIENMLLKKLKVLESDLSSYESMLKPGGLKCTACWQVFHCHKAYIDHISVCPLMCMKCTALFDNEDHLTLHYQHCRTKQSMILRGGRNNAHATRNSQNSKQSPPWDKSELAPNTSKALGCDCVMCA